MGADGGAESLDVVVVGAGAGGMTAALTAALQGLTVVLCEATDQVGGTTATSAGTIWIPGNRHGVQAGCGDSPSAAAQYLDAILGSEDEGGRRRAFLKSGGPAIDYLEKHSEVAFASAGRHPDYLELPGAAVSGRALTPVEFDGRRLGREFDRIRRPLPEFLVFGGMMVNKADIQVLMRRYDSLRQLAQAARLVARYGVDRLRHSRGTRLVLGNALIARLFLSLRRAGVQVLFETRLRQLVQERGRVVGAAFESRGAAVSLRARVGVVLATGGIGHNRGMRAELAPAGMELQSLVFEGNTGDGIVAAQHLGARLERHEQSFFWQPISRVPRSTGSTGLFPHLYLDRAKPGLIAVNATGERFVNEGASYHHFVEGMLRANARTSTLPAYLICDADFVRTYGLGVIPPGRRDLSPYEGRGYIVSAQTPAALAAKLGIDPGGLAESVRRNNHGAQSGHDPLFGKGATELSRFNGDPDHTPNPCLGPIETAPFCALPVWPADAASSSGLATDADGRVLEKAGAPIPGLYACGNDMASIMRGAYPGPGATIGPAMVFGYRIGMHAKTSSVHSRPPRCMISKP